MVTSPYEWKIFKWDKNPKQKQAIHHKIIEYTLQDIEHTLQDIEHTSKDYKIYTTGY